MKLLTSFMLLSMFFTNTSQGGGVTVGNGQGRFIVGITLQDRYLFEDQLKKSAEDLIDLIHLGKFKRINEMIEVGQCDPSYIKINDLRAKRFYIIEEGVFKKEKEYIGYLQIELKDCLNIDAIMADDPYGGTDFWEN